jgi:hypothetical protein
MTNIYLRLEKNKLTVLILLVYVVVGPLGPSLQSSALQYHQK